MKKIVVFLALIATGCATEPMPKSSNYCAPGVTENCRHWTPSERNGAATRGHGEEINEK